MKCEHTFDALIVVHKGSMLTHRGSFGKNSVNRTKTPEFANAFSLALESGQGWSAALTQTGGISLAVGEINFGQEQPRSHMRIACEVAGIQGFPTGIKSERDTGHKGTVCVGRGRGPAQPDSGRQAEQCN